MLVCMGASVLPAASGRRRGTARVWGLVVVEHAVALVVVLFMARVPPLFVCTPALYAWAICYIILPLKIVFGQGGVGKNLEKFSPSPTPQQRQLSVVWAAHIRRPKGRLPSLAYSGLCLCYTVLTLFSYAP